MTKRLLILSHDVVGSRMAGPGIRYWELARALAPHAAVTLAAPQPIDLQAPGVATASFSWGDPASLAPLLDRADVALANGYLFAPHPELAQARSALVVDLYDPTLLENLEALRALPPDERAARSRQDVALLNRQLAAGDLFLCATERQRDLYVGALMAAGRVTPARADRDPQLRRLIAVVGFGLPAEPPARSGPGLRAAFPQIGPDDPIILWSGGLWDWMDPLTLVRAMPAVLRQFPTARLVFLAGAHPGAVDAPRAPRQARELAAELGLLDRHVLFYERWVPYLQRADVLLDATVVVSLHRNHLETAYAALRSRFLDHLWAGLPSVLAGGDTAAALAHDCGLGIVVRSEHEADVSAALCRILGDDEWREGIVARVRALAPRFQWPNLVEPILEFLASPAAARRERAAPHQPMQQPPAPEPTDVAQVERERLLQLTRNSAVQAVEQTWRLEPLAAQARGGPLGRIGQVVRERLLWPLLHPLIARQQEQNAAVLRAIYAVAELSDHQRALYAEQLARRIDRLQDALAELNERHVRERHLVAQQTRDFAEQLAGLEEAELQLRALLRGEPSPPPAAGGPPQEA